VAILRRQPSSSHALVKRALLIVNPASRRGQRLYEAALHEFRRAGVECDTVLTEQAGHAADLARALAPKYDAVFTLGGDGTAMEVVGALAPDGPPVGILPGGTGNLLARALNISLNVRKAVRQLLGGDITRIDLGCLADGRRFAIGVGVGIDAAMIAETPAHWKRRIGVASYVVVAARAVLRQERFTVRVVADGVTLERQASAVLVVNFGALLNNLITLGEGITHDDGVLNVCIFDPPRFPDAVRVMRKLLLRDFRPDPAISYLAGKNIRVETIPPRIAQADGDLIGQTPFSVVTEPSAGCIIVPHCQLTQQ
jgi:YegS/Rv2252/BmrU family lipid kinase